MSQKEQPARVAYLILVGEDPVAYVDSERAIVEKSKASLLEPCLMAYGYAVNFGLEDAATEPRRVAGYRVVPVGDKKYKAQEVAVAVKICAALVAGLRPRVEDVGGKVYEAKSRAKGSEERVYEVRPHADVEFEVATR